MTKLLIEQANAETFFENVDGKKTMKITGPFLLKNEKNRNGRIYPGKVMDAAVEKYIRDYVKTNRALGEMNHPCFSRDAKVFVVDKGLIPITDVVSGDYVYGMDSEWNTIPVLVKETTKNHFNGNLLEFDSRSFRATVTPYHRFYLKDRYGNVDVKKAFEIKEDIDSGKRTLSHSHIPLTMENWIGNDDEEFIQFTQLEERRKNYHMHAYGKTPLVISMKDYCAFMGIFLSEGNVTYKKRTDGSKMVSSVCIHQNLGSALELIFDIIDRIGFNKYKVRIKEGTRAYIEITDVRIADHLVKFGDCYEKFVPSEILGTTKENIREFLDWFHLGDGALSKPVQKLSTGEEKEYVYKNVFTVSEKLADGLIECILKIGHSTTKRVQLSKKDYIFANHMIEIANKSPLFRMTLGNSQGKYVDGRFLDVKEVPYDDDVFCLVTETGNFFVEQYGTCFLSGNCDRVTIDPERACILTEDLQKDGNYYIGKAKVLSTPLGKLLANLLEDGVRIGVSSRGLGSITKKDGVIIVKDGYEIRTAADVVFDPSVATAFVDILMEDVHYLKYGNVMVERDIYESKERIKKASMTKLEEQKLKEFQNFLNKISLG